jgi:hypothetical protein
LAPARAQVYVSQRFQWFNCAFAQLCSDTSTPPASQPERCNFESLKTVKGAFVVSFRGPTTPKTSENEIDVSPSEMKRFASLIVSR